MAIVAQLAPAWDGSGRAQLASAWAEEAESGIQIHDDFERCSINAALSSVGVSDFASDDGETVPLITMRQRLQVCTSMGANALWMEPYGKITGVLGLRPRVEIVPFGDGSNHQTWNAAQRGHYSYDGLTWHPIATKTYATRLSFRHDQPFEQDTVYIARSWPRPLSVIGGQIEAIAAAHPSKVFPTPSALSFTPVNTTGFPAQAFIAGECAPKTDELGRTVPHTPLYAFEINDSSHAGPKRDAHIIAGIHSGEDLGEIVFWEMIDFLLNSPDPAAVTVRENFRVFVYPCANPPGRYAGYWRGSPGTDLDPNRYFTATTPPVAMDYIPLCRSTVLADHAGRRVYWAWNIHASPSGEVLQVGPKEESPGSIAWDAYARARHPAGSWGDYYDRTQPYSADLPGTVTQWQRTAFTTPPVVQMLFETCDRVTPVSPALMRPYAEASIGALADMDAAGWFDPANLTAQDAAHAHAADNLTLSAGLSLVIQDATHAQAADSLAPTTGLSLAIQEALHSHTADSAVLAAALTLAVQDASHTHAADAAALSASLTLAVQDALHAHATDALTLTADTPSSQTLTVAEATHAHLADALALAAAHTLAVQDATHGHTVEALAISAALNLLVNDALHAQLADNATLTDSVSASLVVADAAHSHLADALTLSGALALIVQDAAHAHLSDQALLSAAHSLVVQDAAHAHLADTLALNTGFALTIADAFHAHVADGVSLDTALALAIDDALHAHQAEAATLTAALTLIVADTLHEHLASSVGVYIPTPTAELLRRSVFVRLAERRPFVRLAERRPFVREEDRRVFTRVQ